MICVFEHTEISGLLPESGIFADLFVRHCERSEAIQMHDHSKPFWIASLLRSSQ